MNKYAVLIFLQMAWNIFSRIFLQNHHVRNLHRDLRDRVHDLLHGGPRGDHDSQAPAWQMLSL